MYLFKRTTQIGMIWRKDDFSKHFHNYTPIPASAPESPHSLYYGCHGGEGRHLVAGSSKVGAIRHLLTRNSKVLRDPPPPFHHFPVVGVALLLVLSPTVVLVVVVITNLFFTYGCFD